jgi:hypothetical protein
MYFVSQNRSVQGDMLAISSVLNTVLVVIHGPLDFYSFLFGIGPAGVRRSARAQESKRTDWATPPLDPRGEDS